MKKKTGIVNERYYRNHRLQKIEDKMARIKEFGRIALNSRDADTLINDIEDAYNISDFSMEDLDYGTEFDA